MAIADAAGLPVAACLASALLHEVKLAETALDSLFLPEKPKKLIGDKVYDSEISMIIFLKNKALRRSRRIAATARSQKLRMAEN